MCGIVGLVSTVKNKVNDAIIKPLAQLEYRGYDSCGVTFYDPDYGLRKTYKAIGGVDALSLSDQLTTRTAIGHTRWATHGSVTIENTHPHKSVKGKTEIQVVHNGVITNYSVMKAKLLSLGYIFNSDTDTEVIAHYLMELVSKGMTLVEAVQTALDDLKGQYSILVSMNDGIIVAGCIGRPLIVYKNFESTYIASDVVAFTGMKDGEILYLDDYAVVQCIRGGEVNLYSFTNKVKTKFAPYSPQKEVSLNKKRTLMEYEIHEQPDVLSATIEDLSIDSILETLKSLDSINELGDPVFKFIGCGTSYNAAKLAAFWFNSMGIPASSEVSSEFARRLSDSDNILETNIYVFISQSGETADTINALRRANNLASIKHNFAIAICNVKESQLVRDCDAALITSAGIERSVASTKAFTCQLVAIIKLLIAVCELKKQETCIYRLLDRDLLKIPAFATNVIKHFDAGKFKNLNQKAVFFLGNTQTLPIASEGALKLLEIAYIPSLVYNIGELKHGPLALIEDGTPVFVCLNEDKGKDFQSVISSISQIESRNGRVFIICDSKIALDVKASGLKAEIIDIPKAYADLGVSSSICAAIILQLISHEIAFSNGVNVDRPRNLAKSVTVS